MSLVCTSTKAYVRTRQLPTPPHLTSCLPGTAFAWLPSKVPEPHLASLAERRNLCQNFQSTFCLSVPPTSHSLFHPAFFSHTLTPNKIHLCSEISLLSVAGFIAAIAILVYHPSKAVVLPVDSSHRSQSNSLNFLARFPQARNTHNLYLFILLSHLTTPRLG